MVKNFLPFFDEHEESKNGWKVYTKIQDRSTYDRSTFEDTHTLSLNIEGLITHTFMDVQIFLEIYNMGK